MRSVHGKHVVILCLLIASLVLSGCGVIQQHFPLPTAWDFPTLTPRPTHTATQTPTPTATHTFTPTEITPAQAGTSLNIDWTGINPENASEIDLILEAGKGIPQQFDLSANGSQLAIATSNGVYLHDPDTLEETLGVQTGVLQRCVAISSGGVIASGDQLGKVSLWDEDGTLLASLPAGSQPVLAVAFSPDGSLLAASTWDARIHLWQLSDFTLQHSLDVFLRPVEILAFSAEGTQLFAWAPKESVQVWQVEDGRPQPEVYIGKDGRGYLPSGGAFEPNGSLFAANYGRTVRIVRMRNGTTLRQITDLQNPALQIALSPDGSMLAALRHATASVWNLETGALFATIALPENEETLQLVFSVDSLALFTLGSSIQRWSLAETPSGTNLAPEAQGDIRYHSSIHAASRYTHENELIFLAANGGLEAFDFDSASLRLIGPPGEADYTSYALSPAGLAALGTQEGRVLILEQPGMETNLGGQAHSGPVRSLAFSDDDSLLASGGEDNLALVWSLETGKLLHSLEQDGPPQGMLFTPDHEMLIVRTRNGVSIWSLEDETELFRFPGSGMALAADGVILAVTDSSASLPVIQLYRLPSGEPFSSVPLAGNELALSPDHMLLAAAGKDLTLWSVLDGALVHRVPELEISGRLQFTPDGEWLILTAWDGSLRVWGVPD